jgi:hypothetical protein
VTTPADALFGFNPHQRRGPDGRWIKMGGPGSAGGRNRGSGRRNTRPQPQAEPQAPAKPERSPEVRSLLDEARRIGAAQLPFEKPDGGPSWVEELADRLEARLDAGETEDQAGDTMRALRSTIQNMRQSQGLDEVDQGDGIARGRTGWRQLRAKQEAQLGTSLTEEQVGEGLVHYVSNPTGYKKINAIARDPELPYKSMTKAQKDNARRLDNIVSIFNDRATTLDQETEVYRGVVNPGAFLGGLEPGLEFVDHAPVSTTFDGDRAAAFATDFDTSKDPSNSAIFKIRVKPGQKGLVVDAARHPDGRKPRFMGERELLMPPGTRFRVVERTEDTVRQPPTPDGKKPKKPVNIPTYIIEVVETPIQARRTPAPLGGR